MSLFEDDVIKIYGNQSKSWLLRIRIDIVREMAKRWGLSGLRPVKNLPHVSILSGFQGDQPIILKLGTDVEGLKREAATLSAFAEFGSVRFLVQAKGALLLERAIPGASLKSFFPSREYESIQIACSAIKKFRQVPVPKGDFPSLRDWLSLLDKEWNIPLYFLKKAGKLRDGLLATSSSPVLLHGDLHHDNIVQAADSWLVIDPKGVLGESAYEAAAFIRNPIPELLFLENAMDVTMDRIAIFSKTLDLNPQRIRDWCFVQAVLAWVWALEDGVEADYFSRLTEIYNGLIIARN